MEQYNQIVSIFPRIVLDDIDTDLIIPAEYLKSISRDGYGDALFRRLRDTNPDFPLNNPSLRTGAILVAGKNFGCGSSREHAVWALHGWGFRAVIAESFADIFAGNSAKNGLLLVILREEEIAFLRQTPEDTVMTVDLEAQQVVCMGRQFSFPMDPFKKHCFLNGLDELQYLLSRKEAARAYFNTSSVHAFQMNRRGDP